MVQILFHRVFFRQLCIFVQNKMIPILLIIGAVSIWLMFRKMPGGKHHYRSNSGFDSFRPESDAKTANNFEPGGRFYQPEKQELSLNERIRLEKEKLSGDQPKKEREQD